MVLLLSPTILPTQQEGQKLLAELPFLPVVEHRQEWRTDLFTFSMKMLGSVNHRTQGKGHHVKADYRRRELEEVERIAVQRDYVGWQSHPTDGYAIHYVFRFGRANADIHNPIKPTCDLFGRGRYQSIRGGKGKRVFIPHAQIIWDDSHVWDEKQTKVITPYRKGKTTGRSNSPQEQWATITLIRWHQDDLAHIPIHRIFYELMCRYDPRITAQLLLATQDGEEEEGGSSSKSRNRTKASPSPIFL